jgi:hypothetical protein
MELREKAVRLFTYLKEVTQLRVAVVRDHSNYESVLWFHEIPRERGCYSIAWDDDKEESGLWLEVEKQDEPTVPSPPEICTPWLVLSSLNDSAQEPTLLEKILAPQTEPESETDGGNIEPPKYLELKDHPEVASEWTKYLEHAWKPWAEKHQRWKNVQRIYARLFTAYQQQKRLGEAYELVLGLGLLTWICPSGQRVRRHLLVGQANLAFDANRAALSVQAASDGVKLVR